MIDAKTALNMTEEVRQKAKSTYIWENIEKQIISKIIAGKQVCIVEVFPDNFVSKNEIVEKLISLGYKVTENTYNLDDLLDDLLDEAEKDIGSSEVIEKEPNFMYELIIRW